MANVFAITAATSNVRLDAQRRGELSFTVSNTSSSEIWGRARLATVPPNEQYVNWLTIAGEVERKFDIAGTQQYTVQIKVPPDAAAGDYLFRLDMASVRNPDEEFAEGPTVTMTVPPSPPEKKKFPWWIVIVAAVVLLVIVGVIAFVLTRPEPQIGFNSTNIDFGSTESGQPSFRTLTISNAGQVDLDVEIPPPSASLEQFSWSGGNLEIPPDDQVDIQLTFQSFQSGDFETTLLIESNAPGSPHAITLTGECAFPC